MNRAIEFHDSTLAAVEFNGSTCAIKFRPAYVHESTGEAGVDEGSGSLQDIDIIFESACVAGVPSGFPVDLSDGFFVVAGLKNPGLVGLPLEAQGGVVFRLLTVKNEELKIEAKRAHSIFVSEAKFVEKFPGNRSA